MAGVVFTSFSELHDYYKTVAAAQKEKHETSHHGSSYAASLSVRENGSSSDSDPSTDCRPSSRSKAQRHLQSNPETG